jgi:WD40 repeat protein
LSEAFVQAVEKKFSLRLLAVQQCPWFLTSSNTFRSLPRSSRSASDLVVDPCLEVVVGVEGNGSSLGDVMHERCSDRGACALQPQQEVVRVYAHKKVFREFTGLRLVQTLKAHGGVIWRVAFNDTGAFMATAGKDRVVRIWENRRAPIDRCALLNNPFCKPAKSPICYNS